MSTNLFVPPKAVEVSAPQVINDTHVLTQFDSGEPSIDTYLSKALKNQAERNAVVYVICIKDTQRVVGYFTLSNGSVPRLTAPGALKRNAPTEIPVTILGRMGVDRSIQGMGYGQDLLAAAIEISMETSERVGSKALLVTALSDSLKRFYQKAAFTPMPDGSMTLYLKL